jgi:hypothetical protein
MGELGRDLSEGRLERQYVPHDVLAAAGGPAEGLQVLADRVRSRRRSLGIVSDQNETVGVRVC